MNQESFNTWADAYFAPETGRLNTFIPRMVVLQDFQQENNLPMNVLKFSVKLKFWAEYRGYVYNPADLCGHHGQIIRLADVVGTNGEIVSRVVEMIYIQSHKQGPGLTADISKSIRTVREAKRFTQQEVAELLQMERSNYARLEARGSKLTVEQLEKIAEVLGVSVFVLLGQDEENIDKSWIDESQPLVFLEEKDGLTLRDQFAMAALPIMMYTYGKTPMTFKWTYEVADMMMEARKKEGGEA
ncbi:MAG: helix-turn-helix transcriptional regulator [Spirosomataceae bacterium]